MKNAEKPFGNCVSESLVLLYNQKVTGYVTETNNKIIRGRNRNTGGKNG